jgi:hypothetical protein
MSTKQIISFNIPLELQHSSINKWILSCRTYEQLMTMEAFIRRLLNDYSSHHCLPLFKKDFADTLQMQRVHLQVINADIPSFRQPKN